MGAPGVLLVSFDIDGTLEVGDPPGPITLEMVRYVQQCGHWIGSCSDRTLEEQRKMWRHNEIEADFVRHKHRIKTLRDDFDCGTFIHIGDTIVDSQFALEAGFTFWYAADLPLTNPEVTIMSILSPEGQQLRPVAQPQSTTARPVKGGTGTSRSFLRPKRGHSWLSVQPPLNSSHRLADVGRYL